MKKRIYSTLLVLGLSVGLSNSIPSTAASAKAYTQNKSVKSTKQQITMTQKDGYILFSYCYQDALALQGKQNKTINKQPKKSLIQYNFKEHVLSCGTHMNGYITEQKYSNYTAVKGNFNVTKNPYSIKKLLIDLKIDKNDPSKMTGIITVDGKKYDVNLLR